MGSENEILVWKNVTGKSRGFHLQNISLSLQAGYIYALVGANGAGKTTLMKYIMDEDVQYDGEIFVAGENLRGNHARLMNQIGYVSEDNRFFEEKTGRQNAALLGGFYDEFDMGQFEEAMKRMGLSPGKLYGKMSRGERLKFQLAFAIAHKPCLYLLDEVTAGMDPVFRIEFFEVLSELIRDEECSVLMTSHIQSEIEQKTDFVGIMEQGRLIKFGESLDVLGHLQRERKVIKDDENR